MRKSLLKAMTATVIVGAAMLVSSVAAWADSTLYTVGITTPTTTTVGKWVRIDSGDGTLLDENPLSSANTAGVYHIIGHSNFKTTDKTLTSNGPLSNTNFTKYTGTGENTKVGSYAFYASEGDRVDFYYIPLDTATYTYISKTYSGNYNNADTTEENLIASDVSSKTKDKVAVLTATIPADGIYYCGLGNKKGGFYGIEITPANEAKTTIYNLTELTDTYQAGGTPTGELAYTSSTAARAPKLQIDATNGKVGNASNGWSQFNAGTILTIPNVPAGAKVSVTAYKASPISINGGDTQTDASNNFYAVYKNTSASAQDVVISNNSDNTNGHIGVITVLSTDFPEVVSPTTYTTTYSFPEIGTAIYESTSTTKTGTFAATDATDGANAPDITINTTNGGKFGNSNGTWAQFNEGTILTIPNVPAGATVTVDLYNTTSASVNGETKTGRNQAITTEKAGDVVIISETDGYIASVKVESTSAFPTATTIASTAAALQSSGDYYTASDAVNTYIIHGLTASDLEGNALTLTKNNGTEVTDDPITITKAYKAVRFSDGSTVSAGYGVFSGYAGLYAFQLPIVIDNNAYTLTWE